MGGEKVGYLAYFKIKYRNKAEISVIRLVYRWYRTHSVAFW